MSTYKGYMTNLHCQKRALLACSSMNIFANYRFYSSKVIKINFLTLLSSGYHMPKKLIKKNSDIYKFMVKENSSI